VDKLQKKLSPPAKVGFFIGFSGTCRVSPKLLCLSGKQVEVRMIQGNSFMLIVYRKINAVFIHRST
jgi:hypothetical protein